LMVPVIEPVIRLVLANIAAFSWDLTFAKLRWELAYNGKW
jgi:hypothetical protein